MEFNNQTLTYTSDTNKCVANTTCGTVKANSSNNTIYVCYDTAWVPCSSSVGCDKPEGYNGKYVACGYFKIDGTNLTSGGQCTNWDNCAESGEN